MAGPISLEDAKAYLRVDDDFEDVLIQQLVDAAARHIENVYGVVSVERLQAFTFDRFSSDMRLSRKPVQPVGIAVKYFDSTGAEIDLAGARAVERDGWFWLYPSIGSSWPRSADAPGAIIVTATVGFEPDAAPEDLKQAARLLVDHWYTTRDYSSQPASVDFLIDHYRFRRV